jgi:hypothetical protein
MALDLLEPDRWDWFCAVAERVRTTLVSFVVQRATSSGSRVIGIVTASRSARELIAHRLRARRAVTSRRGISALTAGLKKMQMKDTIKDKRYVMAKR